MTVSKITNEISLRNYFAANASKETIESITGLDIGSVRKFLQLPDDESYDSSKHWPRAEARARFIIADIMVKEATSQLQLSIQSCTIQDDDYLTSIQRPDGSIVKVLIPCEGVESYINDIIPRGHIYGLNCITEGHYL